MATDIPLGLSKAFRWVPHKVCDSIGCNHNRITKPTKTQIRTHLQKVCVRIFQYGAKLATDPREANASACTTHEPAPKGMVQPPFRPIRLWRDLRSKMIHCTVFARRYARRRGPTGCGARIGQRPLAGRRLCDCGPGSGSLFPPQAAAAFAAVLVPDDAQTAAAFRITAIKKQPYAFRKAAPTSGPADRRIPRGLSRALKRLRRSLFARRSGRRARAVLVPDGAPTLRPGL